MKFRIVSLLTSPLLILVAMTSVESAICENQAYSAGAKSTVKIENAPVKKTPANSFSVNLQIELPHEYHLNSKAPSQITYWINELPDSKITSPLTSTSYAFTLPSPKNLMSFEIRVDTKLYYCKDDLNGICIIKNLSIHQPIEIQELVIPDSQIELNAELR